MSLTSKQINELRTYAKDRKGELAKLITDAADTIEMLSAKLSASNMNRSSQYYHGGWIPCDERLPEEYGNYLATMNDGDVRECTYSPEKNTRFMRGGWSACESDGIFFLGASEVAAWMPLPEPYKGGDELCRD